MARTFCNGYDTKNSTKQYLVYAVWYGQRTGMELTRQYVLQIVGEAEADRYSLFLRRQGFVSWVEGA